MLALILWINNPYLIPHKWQVLMLNAIATDTSSSLVSITVSTLASGIIKIYLLDGVAWCVYGVALYYQAYWLALGKVKEKSIRWRWWVKCSQLTVSRNTWLMSKGWKIYINWQFIQGTGIAIWLMSIHNKIQQPVHQTYAWIRPGCKLCTIACYIVPLASDNRHWY